MRHRQSSQILSWCSALSTIQRGLLGMQSHRRKSALLAPFPSPETSSLHPSAFSLLLSWVFTPNLQDPPPLLCLCVRAELGGFGIIPIPPGSSGTRPEQGKGPRVGTAGFGGLESCSRLHPGLNSPRGCSIPAAGAGDRDPSLDREACCDPRILDFGGKVLFFQVLTEFFFFPEVPEKIP